MAITVWKDGTWKAWTALDATYAQDDPDWLSTIPLPMWKMDDASRRIWVVLK